MSPVERPSITVLHEVVELACRAPSIFNSQPWAWRVDGPRLELHADRSRGLPAVDPEGRDLLVSCGAALHHAQVAAAATGWTPSVHRRPNPEDEDHLATITFVPSPITAEHSALLRALDERRTDRRSYSSWPIAPGLLTELARTAGHWGARAVPVTDEASRFVLERLVAQALAHQATVEPVVAEQASWLDRSTDEGVPATTVPRLVGASTSHRSRFGAGLLPQPDRESENVDGVLVIGGHDDEPAAWLRSGEALSALWLDAVASRLSVLPLTQVVEVDETRRALQQDVLGGEVVPHVLVRVGWHGTALQPIGRTPRRPLHDVLLP
ncbi:Acg family FMN-binding oxidoreductase [Nocardioides euryhalodurans]|uniref:NAD(P)H nitroreductase n=1 Tax=Nocardioides euryhalodurans TaxID=2518370 RepID=A0A4P7GP62_9ACTN|nr:NAD(P)H nitroreductase [Nocardioides euryhalodurans]QBR93883.1 NAD(P)H nitroreductase [Nocardioides euryhalodurans]